MPEIGHKTYFQGIARTNGTSSYVTGTGNEILGSDLVADTDYLLLFVIAHGGSNVGQTVFEFQILENGVGALTASHVRLEPQDASINEGHPYIFMVRVTTANPPNNYEFQFKTDGAFTAHTSVNGFYALALRLDEITEDTDFFWDEDTTNHTDLDTTFKDGASETIGDGVSNYLAISCLHVSNTTSLSAYIDLTIDVGGTEHAKFHCAMEDVLEQYCLGTATC